MIFENIIVANEGFFCFLLCEIFSVVSPVMYSFPTQSLAILSAGPVFDKYSLLSQHL